jgi:hypothetical protein
MVREPWVLDRGNLRENWGKSEPWEDGPIYGPPGTRALRYAGTGTGCGVHATVACAQQCHLRDCGARATDSCICATVACVTVACVTVACVTVACVTVACVTCHPGDMSPG